MKIVSRVVGAILLLFSINIVAAPYKEGLSEPIVFEIVGDDKVLVNTKESTVKDSWRVASEFVAGAGVNRYRIVNSEKYPEQANKIQSNMDRVERITGVEFVQEQ